MEKVRSWQAREIYWRTGALVYGGLMLQQTKTASKHLWLNFFMHEQVCVSELGAIERRSTTSRLRLYISLSVNAIYEYVSFP
jgi:hypothetical protein